MNIRVVCCQLPAAEPELTPLTHTPDSHPSLTPSLSAADVLPKNAHLYPHDAYSCFAPITLAPIKLNSNKHAQRIGSLAESGDSVHLAVAF